MAISNATIGKYVLLVLGAGLIWLACVVIVFVYHNSGYEQNLPKYIRFDANKPSKTIHLHSENSKDDLALSQFKFELNPSGWVELGNISLQQRMGCCGLSQMYMSFTLWRHSAYKRDQIRPDSVCLKFSFIGHELGDSAQLHWADSTIIYLEK